ncbi:hypothetical protein KGY47_01015 [Candidatus Bipolaricaulota bacterium]|nr:hypothetical protein [Candidatus Bipolaricaulota bacterium]
MEPVYQFLSFKPITILLNDPHGITCGPGGLLYVAETYEGRIVRFTQEGQYKEEVVVDEPGSGFSGKPLNLTFGPGGNLFFITPDNGIWLLEDGDPRKNPEKLIKGSYFDQDEKPHALAFLKTGDYSKNLIVSVLTDKPYEGYVIRIPAPDYNQVRPFITSYYIEEMGNKIKKKLKLPVALAVNKIGEVFLGDYDKRGSHVLRYAPDGSFIDVFVEKINRPLDLKFSASGNLYATMGALNKSETSAGGIKVFDRDGGQQMFIPRSNLWGVALCES